MKRAALLTVMLLGACQPRTEMMIGIVTDIRAPDILNAVQLNVTRTRDGFPEQQLPPWTITGIPNQPFNLPGSYGVYSPDGSEVKVQIELTGLKNDVPVLQRHAIVSLVNGKTLFLRMGLAAGCMSVKDCSATQTCVEGQCRERLVDVRQLPEFFQNLVTELTCDSGTHFIDTATGDPMPFSADAMNCPSGLCSEGTCLKPPPDDAGVQRDMASVDPMPSDASTSSLRGCPGDALGTAQLMATTTGVSGIFVDPMSGSLVWTEDMSGTIMMSDPCIAGPQTVASAPGVQGSAIQGGQLFYFGGGSLAHVTIAPNSTPMVITDAPGTAYVTTDGTDLYYLVPNGGGPGSTIGHYVNGSISPTSLQVPPVSPQGPLLTVGGGNVFWYDTAIAPDMGSLGVAGANIATGGPPVFVAPVTMGMGLFADATNIYWTDASQGLMLRPQTGMPAQQIAPPATMNDTGGRLVGDGTYLYFTSVKGTGDVVLQALPQASATVQTLATGQSVDTTGFPKLAVGAHGVYWVDTTAHIWRVPALP